MILDDNLKGFISSFEPDLSEGLKKIEKYGYENEVPIIKKDARSVLRFLINIYKPEKVLEVGTAIGFSAGFMAEHLPKSATIVTLEKMEERNEIAKKNFADLGLENRITLMEGDATDSLESLAHAKASFDFVFLDAAKAQYSVYLSYITPMLKSGAVLLTDNILQEGSVADSKFSVTRRDRTIHLRMREYLYNMMHSDEYDSVIIPIGDGMLVSVKK